MWFTIIKNMKKKYNIYILHDGGEQFDKNKVNVKENM